MYVLVSLSAADTQEIVNSWRAEHAGWYDGPGYRRHTVARSDWDYGPAAERASYAGVDLMVDVGEHVVCWHPGLTERDGLLQWLSAGGNVWQLEPETGLLEFWGRRHAFRMRCPRGTVLDLQSRRMDLDPWDTAGDEEQQYAVKGVTNKN
jgi:hypothetical protein